MLVIINSEVEKSELGSLQLKCKFLVPNWVEAIVIDDGGFERLFVRFAAANIQLYERINYLSFRACVRLGKLARTDDGDGYCLRI